MRNLVVLLLTVFVGINNVASCLGAGAEGRGSDSSDLLQVYKVNKRVRDFPEKEDFSTPEAAYAVINRVLASGQKSAWRRISVKKLAARLSSADAKKEEVKPEDAKVWLNARIVEVRIFKDTKAVIISELQWDGKPPQYDKRTVELEDGRWLNAGHGFSRSIGEARGKAAGYFAQFAKKTVRPSIDDPESYLKPFVKFLKKKGKEPKEFVMKALAEHKIVLMGETHHRPRYWAFNSSLVIDPDFPKHVGAIYMELPSHAQDLVDTFLAGEKCDTMPVIEMLRDNLWMGWPDQPMLDFFMTVWMVNQNLEPAQRLRIVLVDMQRPWKKIQERGDWRKYEQVSRDRQMAENILQDMSEHPNEKRNCLFIVGVGHTGLNLKYFGNEPVLMAGWYLREELGSENVYAIFQHESVGTNWGRIDGRLCLGLFDSAFAAVGNKPMAFPLDIGPFGKEPFDAFADRPMQSSYRDGYNAYLYLGRLETEIFSPLIAGFYTDEFVQELERRYRIMHGKTWSESYRRDKADAESFIAWMGNSWGKPRKKWQEKFLGPMNAWQKGGSDWKKSAREEMFEYAIEHPEEIVNAAKKLFHEIRTADYDNPKKWKKNRDAWKEFISAEYCVATGYPGWVKWICDNFKDNPIESVELGNVFFKSDIVGFFRRGNKPGLPAIPYKLILKDGTVLEGILPFDYSARGEYWMGYCGIDWHLQK